MMSVSWQSIRRILVQSFCLTADREIPPNEFTLKHLYNIYTMLDQRRRRWADVVFLGYTNVLCLLGEHTLEDCPEIRVDVTTL